VSACLSWLEKRRSDVDSLIGYLRYSSTGSLRLIRAYSEEILRPIIIFGVVLSSLMRWLWLLAATSFLLSIPIYILKELSVRDGEKDSSSDGTQYVTHSHMYRWLWTMAFLSGKVPALLLLATTLVCLMLFSFILNHVSRIGQSSSRSSQPDLGSMSIISSSAPGAASLTLRDTSVTQSPDQTHGNYWFVLLVFVANIAIVGTVNGLYLWSTLVDLSADARTGIQLAFALFSFVWSMTLRAVIPSRIKESKYGVWLFACLNVGNSVLIPCLVTSLSSPSCYQVRDASFLLSLTDFRDSLFLQTRSPHRIRTRAASLQQFLFTVLSQFLL
jgi:hypothetical protein